MNMHLGAQIYLPAFLYHVMNSWPTNDATVPTQFKTKGSAASTVRWCLNYNSDFKWVVRKRFQNLKTSGGRFLLIIYYNLFSLPLLPLVPSQLQKSNILWGCPNQKKRFHGTCLPLKQLPAFSMLSQPLPQALGLSSLKNNFFCPQHSFSKYEFGSRPQ